MHGKPKQRCDSLVSHTPQFLLVNAHIRSRYRSTLQVNAIKCQRWVSLHQQSNLAESSSCEETPNLKRSGSIHALRQTFYSWGILTWVTLHEVFCPTLVHGLVLRVLHIFLASHSWLGNYLISNLNFTLGFLPSIIKTIVLSVWSTSTPLLIHLVWGWGHNRMTPTAY